MKLSAWLFAASAVWAGGSAVAAQDCETRSAHCNDAPFGSDGGGISGCLEYALRMDDMFIGIGIFGVSPELKTSGGFRVDPLEEKARINLWAGQIGATDGFEYAYAGRAGIEGGLADDIALDLQEFVHELFDVGLRDLESQNRTRFIGGVSGWVRMELGQVDNGSLAWKALPYAHAAVGLDTVEAGGGLMLTVQASGEADNLMLLMPKNGAYAPVFGGDGIGVFGGIRGVAHEGLYEDLAKPFVAEAGVVAQYTFFSWLRAGGAASCTTAAYDGSDDADCKVLFQTGSLF